MKKNFWLQNLMCLSLFTCFNHSLYALDLSDLSQHLSESEASFLQMPIYEEEEMMFEENSKVLAEGGLQMSVHLLDRSQLDEVVSIFDYDSLTDHLVGSDRLMIARSAVVFRDVSPDFFTSDRMISPAYLAHSMYDGKNKVLDVREKVIEQQVDYTVKKVTSKIKFTHHNLVDGSKHHMSEHEIQEIVDRFSPDETPQFINSTFTGPGDVSSSSYGGRTFNLYYDINGQDTLHVSYKLVTLKKESFYRWIPNLWNMIKQRAKNNLLEGTNTSLKNIRIYIRKFNQGMIRE